MEALVAWSIHNAVSDLVVFGKRGNLMALQIRVNSLYAIIKYNSSLICH